ncbi:MAG: nucleoside monophosphate kinase, partial [Actinomycetota bacterium]|nr:nucleoside monophosphate kinase [Actinomycetota bacterium]
PRLEGRCDVCSGELVMRADDTEDALEVRLRDYHDKTDPVLDLFRRKEYVSRSTRADVAAAAVAGLDLTPGTEVWTSVKATETHAYPA